MSVAVHNFEESLARSHAQADAQWWNEVYRRAWPSLVTSASIRDDGFAQRGGIDRIVVLNSGRQITIDEKVREQDWPDVLLEQWSDEQRKKPGWIQKPLACEYIAYAYIPSRTCLLFPTLTLQRAWRLHGRDWISKYPTVRARNSGYVTASVPVPRKVLFDAIADAMHVEWSA